jgi:hypothetical protein
MNRRQYLAAVTGSLTAVSGCRKWTPGLGKPVARLSVAETTAPNLDVTVEFQRAVVTTARTASLQITWTNTSTDRIEIYISKEENNKTLNAEPPRESFPGLILVPPRYDVLRQTDTSCWVPDGSLGGDGGVKSTQLSPDESVQERYEIWTQDDDPCFASGTYTAGHDFSASASWQVRFNVTNASE